MLTLSRNEGKTLEEAYEKCIKQLGYKKEELYVKETQTETKIFKQKRYIVEAIPKQTIINYIRNYIKELDNSFNIGIKSEINEQDGIIKVVLASDNNPILIGKEGKNIEAIQALLRNSIKNQIGINIKVNMDASNYKRKKEQNFIKEIEKIIKEIEETHIDVKLDPMNSYNRRIVHSLVSNYENLETESVGEEPNRCTIIKYKED